MGGRSGKFCKLNRAMAELVEDFNLVGFVTLNVEDKQSMTELLKLIDKAYGYCFGDRVWPGAWSHCRFLLPLIHFIPDLLTYSVPLFMKRQCDRTLV